MGNLLKDNVITQWYARQKIKEQAKDLVREAKWLLKKKKDQLKDKAIKDIQSEEAALRQAIKDKDAKLMADRVKRCDRALDKHASAYRKSTIRLWMESWGVMLLLVIFLRAFIIGSFEIPSGSMIPSLKVGDRLFVTLFSYGIRIPFTTTKFFTQSPKRGEVIVFIYPGDPSKDYIKRVIAVGGDTIEVKDDIVYVNDKAIPRKKINVPCYYRDGGEERGIIERRECEVFEEEHGGYRYRILQTRYVQTKEWGRQKIEKTRDYPKRKVKEGTVFVMGDNRDNSQDSRFFLNLKGESIPPGVPLKNIKGKARFIWFSNGEPEGIRWSRLFSLIHSTPDMKKPIYEGLSPAEVQSLK